MTKKAYEIAKLTQTVAHVHFVTAASLHFDPLRILKGVAAVDVCDRYLCFITLRSVEDTESTTWFRCWSSTSRLSVTPNSGNPVAPIARAMPRGEVHRKGPQLQSRKLPVSCGGPIQDQMHFMGQTNCGVAGAGRAEAGGGLRAERPGLGSGKRTA